MNIKDILYKIKSLETDLHLYVNTIDDIVILEFYSDESGSIHSSECQFFEFEKLFELKEFMKLSNDYIIRKRKYYPL
jgi:hypothetical protein